MTTHYGDRDYHLEFIKLLKYISEKIGITETSEKKWDLVIDFCAYLRKEVKTIIRGLTNRLKLYVLISTDSVYDVCDTKIRVGPPREIDDLRPHGEKEIRKMAEDEDYGHDKLKCEEYLRSHVANLEDGKFKFRLGLTDFRVPFLVFEAARRYWALRQHL